MLGAVSAFPASAAAVVGRRATGGSARPARVRKTGSQRAGRRRRGLWAAAERGADFLAMTSPVSRVTRSAPSACSLAVAGVGVGRTVDAGHQRAQ